MACVECCTLEVGVVIAFSRTKTPKRTSVVSETVGYSLANSNIEKLLGGVLVVIWIVGSFLIGL